MGQAVSYVAQHEAMSTQQHANRLVPKHATLIKTLVPVAGTVSRRIDPEQTELEDDSIPVPLHDACKVVLHSLQLVHRRLCDV